MGALVPDGCGLGALASGALPVIIIMHAAATLPLSPCCIVVPSCLAVCLQLLREIDRTVKSKVSKPPACSSNSNSGGGGDDHSGMTMTTTTTTCTCISSAGDVQHGDLHARLRRRARPHR